MIGTRLGSYEIVEKIGEGGMGVVYKARDLQLGRYAALKVIDPHHIGDAAAYQRFVHEAKAASALNHPNIVHIYGAGESAGVPYIAMEYLRGETLQQRIAAGPLETSVVLSYTRQVADALAKTHQAGIIHRDLKPGNIMIADDGYVKLLDFGLAKIEHQPASEADTTRTLSSTIAGTVVGTAAYMSPEQAEGKPVSSRSDVFSFGAVLYEMLSGHPAFTGETLFSVVAAVLKDQPHPIHRPVPPGISAVVARCIEKDPAKRFASMTEVRDAIDGLAAAPGKAERSQPPAVNRRVAIGALAGGGLAVATFYLWHLRTPARLDPRLTPITALQGDELFSSFSPDGNQVAFTWTGEQQDNADVYVKFLDGPSILRLTSNPAVDFSPSWSPDGRTIAFLRSLGQEKATLVLIPAIGGAERPLGEIILYNRLRFFQNETPTVNAGTVGEGFPASSIAWSPDSRWLVLGTRETLNGPAALNLISVDTGERRILTNPAAQQWGDCDPAFSPDGRSVAFARSANDGSGEIYIQELTSEYRPNRDAWRVTNDHRRIAGCAWMSPKEIVFSAGDSLHELNLWTVKAQRDGRAVPLAGVSGDACFPAVSRSGKKLAFTARTADVNIWQVEVASQGPSRSRRLIASTRLDFHGHYSPDGKRIAFASNRSGAMELWACDSDGSNSVQISRLGQGNAGSPQWSPDGQWLVFDWNLGGQWDVYRIAAGGGKPLQLTNSPGNDVCPVFSADGRWVYFASTRSGDYRVWKVAADGGEAAPVTAGSGHVCQESPDGAWLYFARSWDPATELWRMPSNGGTESKVIDAIYRRAFVVAREGLYYIPAPDAGGGTSIRLRSEQGVETRLQEIALPISWGLSVHPDGHRLLYSQYDRTGSELMLMDFQ